MPTELGEGSCGQCAEPPEAKELHEEPLQTKELHELQLPRAVAVHRLLSQLPLHSSWLSLAPGHAKDLQNILRRKKAVAPPYTWMFVFTFLADSSSDLLL